MHISLIIALLTITCFTILNGKNLFPQNCPPYQQGRIAQTDPAVRLHDIEFGGSRTFDDDLEVCKLCFDGILPIGDEANLVSNFPRWIGLYRAAGSKDWKWLDGTVLQNTSNSFRKVRYTNLDKVPLDKDYGVLFHKHQGNISWVALERGTSCANRGALRKTLKEVGAISSDDPSFDCNYIIWGERRVDTWKTTCQRPSRPAVHHWNYTEPTCRHTGSKSYNYYMPNCHIGDQEKNNTRCQISDEWRRAFRCNETTAPCKVSTWSEWAWCDTESCEISNRTRTIIYEPGCKYYPHLEEFKNCIDPENNASANRNSGSTTEWSNWGECDAHFCDNPTGTRKRTREKIPTPGCQVYPNLDELKPCRLPGCTD